MIMAPASDRRPLDPNTSINWTSVVAVRGPPTTTGGRWLMAAFPRALSASVNAARVSFLGREVAGRPGPIWSMIAWYAVITALLLTGLVSSRVSPQQVGSADVSGYLIVYCVVAAVIVGWMGARTPGWALHVLVDLNIVVTCLTAASRPSALLAAIPLVTLMFAALYAATWFRQREMVAHLALLTVLSAVVVFARSDDPYLHAMWVTVLMLCWGLGFFVNTLVRDLNRQALSDPLTGLLNRTGLDLVAETRSGDRPEVLPRSVVVLDLEDFKAVNDREGHQAGDRVLREVGSVLRSRLRPSDTAARTGGDEFVVLLPITTVERARAVLMRVTASLPIGCSVGIADWAAGATFEEAVQAADRAMYADKGRKNR